MAHKKDKFKPKKSKKRKGENEFENDIKKYEIDLQQEQAGGLSEDNDAVIKDVDDEGTIISSLLTESISFDVV